ncbi:MAG: gliding motility-associated C-terminal domain-containing protein [Ginsengibacter sp.]
MGKYHLFSPCFLVVLILYFPDNTSAQLCKGSLGDPVVNITFGSGNNPGPSIGNNTNYTYSPGSCPEDGSYTIANSSGNCFGSTWNVVPEDHTPGDNKGYMMVVNASSNPGDFFVKTVDGLCPNTTYEFAAWLYNLLLPSACKGNGIKPDITFNIETTSGTILQTYSTGNIAESTGWMQYGFYFSTTVGINSVVIRMTNKAPGGCGNDLLLDDITFRACGPLVSAAINGSLDSVDVCTGDETAFNMHANVSDGYISPVYQWQVSADNGISFTNIEGAQGTTYIRPPSFATGRYLYRLAVSQQQNSGISSCSIFSNLVMVGVNKYPDIGAISSGRCTGDTLYLKANEGVQFLWSGPGNFSSADQNPFIPRAGMANNGLYHVTATSGKGCKSEDSTIVALSKSPTVFAGNDTELCEGSSIKLKSVTDKNIITYQWSPPAGLLGTTVADPIASPVETTHYILTVSDGKCSSSDSLLITVNKKPTADAGTDKIIIKGQSATLNGEAGGTDVNYLWTPATNITGTSSLDPIVSPPTTQLYTLNVYSGTGCGTATDQILIEVYNQLYIPNAFTPNGDGLNDTWRIEALQAYPGAEVKVYDRFGEMVFDNHGKNIAWDGRFKGQPLSSGVYVYMIDLKNHMPALKGVITLIL